MADNTEVGSGTGVKVASDKVTYSGDADENVQLIRPVLVTGAEGSKTVVDLPGDASNGLDVDVTRIIPGTATSALGKQEGEAHTAGNTGVLLLGVRNTSHTAFTGVAQGDYTPINVDAEGCVVVVGNIAHDSPDADPPVKIGHKAINHGTNPTSVTASDRTDSYANRAGIPWVIGGHPNVQTLMLGAITTAVANSAIVAAAANIRIVVTRITCTLDNASTVFPLVRIGFHATTTPTTTGVLVSHGGVPAGGGFSVGDGSGILGIGAVADALLVTTTGNATGAGLIISVSYYTINEA